jgi:hypothetical protein
MVDLLDELQCLSQGRQGAARSAADCQARISATPRAAFRRYPSAAAPRELRLPTARFDIGDRELPRLLRHPRPKRTMGRVPSISVRAQSVRTFSTTSRARPSAAPAPQLRAAASGRPRATPTGTRTGPGRGQRITPWPRSSRSDSSAPRRPSRRPRRGSLRSALTGSTLTAPARSAHGLVKGAGPRRPTAGAPRPARCRTPRRISPTTAVTPEFRSLWASEG